MSGYKSFAVWGAGHLGKPLLAELIKLKAAGTIGSVSVLTRPESKDNDINKELASQGVNVITFTADAIDLSALTGIDVVISAVHILALPTQLSVVRAAKTAGVKLFVPAEWGDDTDGREIPMLQVKASIRTELENLRLPFASFYNGQWSDFLPSIGYDVKNGKVTIKGEGNSPQSMTTVGDVARFVTHVLTTLPRDQIEWTKFRIEGDRVTPNELTAAYQQASGKQVEIVHVPRSVLEENVAKNPHDIISALYLGWDTGKGVVGAPDQVSNKLWPEWNPKKALDVLLAIV